MALDSPRYFRWAERLHHYNGAVRAVRLLAAQAAQGEPYPIEVPPAVTAAPAGEPVTVVDDVAAIAAMSQTPGFPGIRYTGG